MTETARSLSEVPALLAERRRYEEWLAALESRRDTTPEHVFERVRADYRARLDGVERQLASYAEAIERERSGIESRLSLFAAEEQLRRDERAELELRAHVGELVGDEADAAFRTVDDTLAQIGSERATLERQLAELAELLAGGAAQREQAPPVAAAPEPPPAYTQLDAAIAAWAPDPEAPAPEAAAMPAAPAAAEASEPAVQQPRASAPQIQREDLASDSLLAGLGETTRAGEEPPLAANVPANTPIKLRPSGQTEQSKTLKCTECGAMNYPTEWYCERCGAELAAL